MHICMSQRERERLIPVAGHSMSKLQHQQLVEQMQQQKLQTEKRIRKILSDNNC